ncbi:hypothetical protein CI105_07290 [Candidatus Izimaplasma bacterium ZiA1]|uniref:Fic family protein n=1 Tax=Candidatus Izimoplasma sp. ZiA1 TaxID=2024899 RepID=UPI000BAA3BF9|nr:hypothetical protein CI105_07290 [Candidatus Izimaplasma bacterium ZiA1]
MYRLKKLPFSINLSTKAINMKLTSAMFALGELNGVLSSIKDLDIILKYIYVLEAIESNAIDDYHITKQEVFLRISAVNHNNEMARLTTNYIRAMNISYKDLLNNGVFDVKLIKSVQHFVEPDNSDFRKIPGLKVFNKLTDEVIYVPPQKEQSIKNYIDNLLTYTNDIEDDYHPLIKAALIHFQYEAIHPFEKGNGRSGRILNVLFLRKKELLKYPVFNISKYFNKTKKDYLDLLKDCHNDHKKIEQFVFYYLNAVEVSANNTIIEIQNLQKKIDDAKVEIKGKITKLDYQDFVNHIFKYPYTKNEIFRSQLNISRNTASKYLKELVSINILKQIKVGKEVIYVNKYLST